MTTTPEGRRLFQSLVACSAGTVSLPDITSVASKLAGTNENLEQALGLLLSSARRSAQRSANGKPYFVRRKDGGIVVRATMGSKAISKALRGFVEHHFKDHCQRKVVDKSSYSITLAVDPPRDSWDRFASGTVSLLSLVPEAWRTHLIQLGVEKNSEFLALERSLRSFISTKRERIVPDTSQVFQALNDLTPSTVKVVILGQDPYPNPGHATGRAFELAAGVTRLGPTATNILREAVVNDVLDTPDPESGVPNLDSADGKGGEERKDENEAQRVKLRQQSEARRAHIAEMIYAKWWPRDGRLEHWASQGVLLLNASLTTFVKEHDDHERDHERAGWNVFIRAVLSVVCRESPFVVCLGWGEQASNLIKEVVDPSQHAVLHASHPGPTTWESGSRAFCVPFRTCFHFKKTNMLLQKKGCIPIRWVRDSLQGSVKEFIQTL